MKKRGVGIALILIFLLLGIDTARADRLQADMGKLAAGMPKEVAAFIKRRMQCNRWDEIEAHQKASRRDIDAAQLRLHCDALEWEEKTLRRKHAGEKLVLRRIELADAYS